MVSMRSIFAYLWSYPERVVYFLVCCVLVFLLALKKNKPEFKSIRNLLVIPSLVLIVMFLNPVSTHFLVPNVMETRILRFFWIVPAALIMALVTVELVTIPKNKVGKILAGGIVLGVFAAQINRFSNLRSLREKETPNWYKIPASVIELTDDIMADDSIEQKVAILPQPLNLWVRQYRAEVQLPFSWNDTDEYFPKVDELYDFMNGLEPFDVTEFGAVLEDTPCNYVVLPESWIQGSDLHSYGFEELARVNMGAPEDVGVYDREYILYHRKEAVK